MERVSALRIELYEELQSLPEVLRSEYPDLAVDFLATVFREPPAHPASLTATDELLKGAAAPAFQLLPSPPDGGCSEDGALPAQLAAVQSMLEAAQQEAATIEATASTMPPDGWGDLEMSLQRAAPTPARQQQPGSHAASPAARPPAQLVQCKRCRKVLLACSSPEHQRQCTQQEQLADAGSLSDEPSSSEGVPAAAPSASRGSKRKGLGGAAASGGGAAKHSRPSLAGRRAAVSLEASPSLGEVAQGAPRQRHDRRSAPPPIHIPAAPAAVKPASSAPPGSGNLEPLSPTIHLSSSQRRRRTQHPPRLRRRFLTIHPGRDLEQPLLLNAVATPAVPATFDPAAGAAAAAAALAGAPTVVPLPAPGGTQPVGSAHDLPGPAAAAAPAQATQPAVAVQHATGAGGGWGAEQQAMLQWAMQPQAAAAQQAAAPAALDPAPQPHVSDQQQVNQEPQSAVQQQAPPQQQQQQQQAPAQQTAQPQAQQTQQAQQAQQQVKSQESCRIFQSLTPEQQKALREQLARRKAAQQAAAQQAQAAGAPAAHAHRPPGGASQPPRLAVLSPQQMQQLHQQNVAALQQQQAGRGVPPAGARPHAVFPPGFVMAQPAFHLTAGSAGAAGGLPGTLPMQLAHGVSSSAMPSTAGQSLPGVFLALPAGQPMPGALPLVQQAFQMQQPSMPQQQQQQGGAAGPAAAVQGIAVGIPLPQASGAGMLGGATPAGCFPGMHTQLPLRPSLPVYPGLRPMAAAAGAPVLGMPGPAASAAAGLPAGMMPVGPFPGQQQAALVQQSGVARPSMQFVPAP